MVKFSEFFHEPTLFQHLRTDSESFVEISFLILIGQRRYFIFYILYFIFYIIRTFYIRTRIFYIILKIFSFDFPEKRSEIRIIAGLSLLGDGGSPPTGGMMESPHRLKTCSSPPPLIKIVPVDSHSQQIFIPPTKG